MCSEEPVRAITSPEGGVQSERKHLKDIPFHRIPALLPNP